ncbi:MAG: hypothetical protein RIS92_1618 [Verrucomicrobiota bacterium]
MQRADSLRPRRGRVLLFGLGGVAGSSRERGEEQAKQECWKPFHRRALDGVFGGANGDAFQLANVGVDNLVRDFLNHVFEDETKVTAGAKVCWSDVAHAVGVCGQLVTLFE